MKVLMLDAPQQLIDERRRLGQDARDEIWEGVLHMVPPPSWDHQGAAVDLCAMLRSYCRKHALGTVTPAVGVRQAGSGTSNFRVPDMVFLAKGNERLLDAGHQWIEGGPDVVIEIRSPGDETYDKLAFYASLGVREVVVIDRDSKKVEVFEMAGDGYVKKVPLAGGWLSIPGLKVHLRTVTGAGLEVRLDLDGADMTV